MAIFSPSAFIFCSVFTVIIRMCSAFFRRPFRLKRAIIVKCPPPCHPNGKRKTARLLSQSGCLIGAGTKSRTRDPLITSQVLYQLSYTGLLKYLAAPSAINWCRHQESNSGPPDYKSGALPTELYRQRSRIMPLTAPLGKSLSPTK